MYTLCPIFFYNFHTIIFIFNIWLKIKTKILVNLISTFRNRREAIRLPRRDVACRWSPLQNHFKKVEQDYSVFDVIRNDNFLCSKFCAVLCWQSIQLIVRFFWRGVWKTKKLFTASFCIAWWIEIEKTLDQNQNAKLWRYKCKIV